MFANAASPAWKILRTRRPCASRRKVSGDMAGRPAEAAHEVRQVAEAARASAICVTGSVSSASSRAAWPQAAADQVLVRRERRTRARTRAGSGSGCWPICAAAASRSTGSAMCGSIHAPPRIARRRSAAGRARRRCVVAGDAARRSARERQAGSSSASRCGPAAVPRQFTQRHQRRRPASPRLPGRRGSPPIWSTSSASKLKHRHSSPPAWCSCVHSVLVAGMADEERAAPPGRGGGRGSGSRSCRAARRTANAAHAIRCVAGPAGRRCSATAWP